jgi:hypothetical protein
MKQIPRKRPSGQTWKTFLRNHAAEVWVCDFLQVTDLFFQPLFAFFIIELRSRKAIHVNVTRSPTDPWVAQQLRESTPYGQTPKYLIQDTDRKFGQHFARAAATSGIRMLRTPLWWLHGISAEQIESLPLQLPCALTTICTLSQVWENILAPPGSNSLTCTSLVCFLH